MTRLVIDASSYFPICVLGVLPAELEQFELVAPPLLWSETLSALREASWRGVLLEESAAAAVGRLGSMGVRAVSDPDLATRSYEVAKDLGWAKTYDAEYVALARMLNAPLLTRDARLKRGAQRLVEFLEFD